MQQYATGDAIARFPEPRMVLGEARGRGKFSRKYLVDSEILRIFATSKISNSVRIAASSAAIFISANLEEIPTAPGEVWDNHLKGIRIGEP